MTSTQILNIYFQWASIFHEARFNALEKSWENVRKICTVFLLKKSQNEYFFSTLVNNSPMLRKMLILIFLLEKYKFSHDFSQCAYCIFCAHIVSACDSIIDVMLK